MLDKKPDTLELLRLREAALSRWDNEGGAGPDGPQAGSCTVAYECRVGATPHSRHRTEERHDDAPMAMPYKCTPVFNEHTLPAGLRKEHRTKPGVWGVIRVLEGRVRYQVLDPESVLILDADHPGLVAPDVAHAVQPLCPMRMYVEFYKHAPELRLHAAASMVPEIPLTTKDC